VIRAVVALALLLSGCAAIGRDYPLHDAYREALVARLSPQALTDEQASTMRVRNARVNELTLLLDDEFARYEESLYEESAVWNTLADLAVLGASSGSALAGGVAVKSALAAAAAGITGARITVSKHFFAEANRFAIVAKMRALRTAALVPVEECKRVPIRQCSITDALVLLHRLARAGTLVSALQGLAENAAASLRVESGRLDDVRRVPVVEEE